MNLLNKISGIIKPIVKIANFADKFSGRIISKKIINKKIKEYGEMIDLKIDNKNRNIKVKLRLKGEEKDISLKIGKYDIQKKKETAIITLNNVSSDREWINAAVKTFVNGKSFDVPSNIIDIVDGVLE